MISANISVSVRKSIYRRDNYRCALCDSNRGLQIHHVIHRSQGGALCHPHNLITLCWRCHALAHGTDLREFPWYMNTVEVNQACVEYVADHYAPVWWPWER